MATAGDVITLLRPQLNDNVSPYRHSDADIRRWLSDGQRLIVQLKPEANPATVQFTPVTGAVRQRLAEADAHALIRVEQNQAQVTTYTPDPGFVFQPIRHVSWPGPLVEHDFVFFVNGGPPNTFPRTFTPLSLPTGWDSAPNPALVVPMYFVSTTGFVSNLGLSYGGQAMALTTRNLPAITAGATTYYITESVAILELNPASPPASATYSLTGTGSYTLAYAQHGVFKGVDVPATIAAFAAITTHSTAANGYYIDVGPTTVTAGDMLLTQLWLDWTNVLTTEPITLNYGWLDNTAPPYAPGYWTFTIGEVAMVFAGPTNVGYWGVTFVSYPAAAGVVPAERFHYAFTNVNQFPVGEQGDTYPELFVASPAPAYGRRVRIVAVQGEFIATVTNQYGKAIPAVDRDVYDTFDADWMSRSPSPPPAAPNYFDGFCFDQDDPLGFFLHPKPVAVADTVNRVMLTYAAVPPELTANETVLALSDMYIDPLCNYTMYRAMSAQTQGYSAVGAARAIERFGQQLNLSRETILQLIGEPHRQMEQQQ